MSSKRTQLTLFVPEPGAIENIRRQYNPLQHVLIAAHVTLCREDELTNMELVYRNLDQLDFPAFTLQFGQPVRFERGKGLLLPARGNDSAFHNLRKAVLRGIIDNPREQEAHITLMHPRNSECTDELFEEIRKTGLPAEILFDRISLIEQVDGGSWNAVKEIVLKK
jgi:hypothetical protein